MDWTELCITVETRHAQQACDIAQMVVNGIYLEDYSDIEQQTLEIAHIDLIDEALLKKDREKSILHIYFPPGQPPDEALKFIGGRLESCGIAFSVSAAGVSEQDWANSWKAYYHAVSLSDKIAICPSWEQYSPKPNQKVIRLDPGMAFGTGTHETTRLCLSLLEEALSPGMSMLDVGCGSGILAICAKLLGSGRTVGVDIDEVAVRVAKENAALNGCADIEIFCGDLACDIAETFDVICANIVADAILRLAKDLPALMHEGSVCVVSGIIDTRCDEVEQGLIDAGLAPVSKALQNGWAAIACKKAVRE